MQYQTMTEQDYKDLRYNFIKQVEESGHENVTAYYDTKGLISIGVGFNLHTTNVLEEFLRTAMGVSDQNLSSYRAVISSVLGSVRKV